MCLSQTSVGSSHEIEALRSPLVRIRWSWSCLRHCHREDHLDSGLWCFGWLQHSLSGETSFGHCLHRTPSVVESRRSGVTWTICERETHLIICFKSDTCYNASIILIIFIAFYYTLLVLYCFVTLLEATGCKQVCPPAVKLQKTLKASEVQPQFGSIQNQPETQI